MHKRDAGRVAGGTVTAAALVAGLLGAGATAAQAADDVVIDRDTEWRYLDTGVDPAAGTGDLMSWTDAAFDDSAWKTATGGFGALRNVYEPVMHSRFPVATKLEQYYAGTSRNVETFFFRTTIDLSAEELAQIESFTGSIAFDDAVRVYLNGEYVWGGADGRFDANASTNMQYVGGNGSAPIEDTFSLDADDFVAGENTLAISLHNTNDNSSDVYLDLFELEAQLVPAPGTPVQHSDMVLQPGVDDTSRHVSWMTDRSAPGFVQWAPADTVVDGVFPDDAASADVVESGVAYDLRHYNHAVISGLAPDETYAYRVNSDGTWSDAYEFRTFGDDDGFEFLLMGDAQIGASGNPESDGAGWQATLNTAQEMFPDAEFIHSVGDQVESHGNTNEYRLFLAPDNLRETPISTVIGNHDNFTPAYRQQFFDPNVDLTYGNDGNPVNSNGNSWFIYEDMLVINLNSNTLYNMDAWPTHVAYVEKIMREQGANARWHVATLHHSLFSVANHSTNQQVIQMRNNLAPALSESGVDVVLSGHDHSYARTKVLQGREPIEWPLTNEVYPEEGQTVYVTANSSSGSKYYNPRPAAEIDAEDPNGYDYIEKRWQEYTPSFSNIEVRGDTMVVKTYETYNRSVVDEVTIHLPGTEGPDPSTLPERPEPAPIPAQPAPLESFDDAMFGEVVFEDDFSTDRLDEYTVYGGTSELPATLAVDTERGVLTSTSSARAWSQLALPTDAPEEFALILEPETFLGRPTGEDSVFLGITGGPASRVHSWYNNDRGQTGFDVAVSGRGFPEKSPGSTSVRVEEGDRMAVVMRDGQLSSWVEKSGTWLKLREVWAYPELSVEEVTGWAPTFSLRQDAGTMEVDKVTLLAPAAPETEVTTDEVTFDDAYGTADDTYTVPDVEGVEYLVDGEAIAAGTYPGSGTIVVTARALEGYVLSEGSVTEWTIVFTDEEEPGTDPEPSPEPTDPGTDPEPSPEPTDPGTDPSPEPTDPGTGPSPSPEPTDPGDDGAQVVVPTADSLTDANRGGLVAPQTVTAGQSIEVTVERGSAGQRVHAWLFSTPTAAGSALLGADLALGVRIPADLAAGDHRLVVTATDGTVLGWQAVSVLPGTGAADGTGTLPATGAELGAWWLAALALIAAGAAFIVVRRRRALDAD
jgi:LPXTG-motif cell wall-anchored protein